MIVERGRDDAAAGELAGGEHRVVRSRRHLAEDGERVHQARELGELPCDLRAERPRGWSVVTAVATLMCRSSSARSSAAASSPSALFGESRDRDQRSVTPDSADTTTTGDAATLRVLPAHDVDQAVHGVGIGDRRAAELHDHVHSSPSRCISSAFRIAAPAAPRIVLWPSATNL